MPDSITSGEFKVTTGPLPASRKIYVRGTRHPGIAVAMREIDLAHRDGDAGMARAAHVDFPRSRQRTGRHFEFAAGNRVRHQGSPRKRSRRDPRSSGWRGESCDLKFL